MAVEHDRLQTCEQIVRAIDVRPAHLGAANDRIDEVVNEFAQEIRLGHKVGVKDRNQVSLRRLHAVLKCARFEACAIFAMNVMNIEPLAHVLLDCCARDVDSLVS